MVTFHAWAQPRLEGLPTTIRAELRQNGSRYVPLSQMPLTLQEAVVATEDQTFWTNIGISVEGLARSFLTDVAQGSFVQGGSTITEQLGRDQMLTRKKTISRKVRGLLLALFLAQMYSKRQILEMYLNQVYLGHGATGVAAAASVYFGVPVSRLSPAQCTLLAGLPQAPSAYDPLKHPAAARHRQSEVLQSMVSAGYLTQSRAASIARSPWHLRSGVAE